MCRVGFAGLLMLVAVVGCSGEEPKGAHPSKPGTPALTSVVEPLSWREAEGAARHALEDDKRGRIQAIDCTHHEMPGTASCVVDFEQSCDWFIAARAENGNVEIRPDVVEGGRVCFHIEPITGSAGYNSALP